MKRSTNFLNPEFFGSFFNRKTITFTQAIQTNVIIKRTRTLSTFVPDEIIFSAEPTKKVLRRFSGILLLVEISGLLALTEIFTGGENGGCFSFTNVLNIYLTVIIEHINSYGGDVLKFTTDGLLVLWKVRTNVLILQIIQNVILCALTIHESLKFVNNETFLFLKVKTAISAGHVVFSVIGNEKNRHFVVAGPPVTEVKSSKNVCAPGELILGASAWEHCAPSNYEYVIKDENNVKIIRIILKNTSKEKVCDLELIPRKKINRSTINSPRPSILVQNSFSHFVINFGNLNIANNYQKSFTGRVAIANAVQRGLGNKLKCFMIKPVLNQIEKDQTFDNLTEIKRVTILSVNVIPIKCSVFELISLIDQCYILILRIVEDNNGTVNVNLHGKYTNFEIIFGLMECQKNSATMGIILGRKILDSLKSILALHCVAVGASTGTVFCSVIGHIARRYFSVIGGPVQKSVQIACISINKVCCDTDTLMLSNMKKKLFRSRGLREISNSTKTVLFEYIGDQNGLLIQHVHSLSLVYPIVGRLPEMEIFSEILDYMNVQSREYSGLLIVGPSRIGKSRLLDVYVTIAKSRQIRTIELDLDSSFSSKSNAVIFHVLEQIFECEDCKTIEGRERILIKELCNVIPQEDFCYLNSLMRVRFPLSKLYCSETDWERHLKRVRIVYEILRRKKERLCIILDNVQFMDIMSWQYLCKIMNNSHIIFVMAMMKSKNSEEIPTVQLEILKNEKLQKHVLGNLPSGFITALACQYLNVCAIPQELERLLVTYSDHNPEWCELFLTTILQSHGLNFVSLTPEKAKQHNLIFPDNILLSKIHVDLLSEEVVPPKSWGHMDKVSACLINDKFTGHSDSLLTIDEMKMQIFERMIPHEQEIIKCASSIGDVFSRETLMLLIKKYSSLNVAKVMESMIRIRILECASIRRPVFLSQDMTFCSFRKRNFSDVHNLIQCRCFRPRSFPPYAYCRFLEFKSTTFREKIYSLLSVEEKVGFYRKTVEILEKDFRKCEACGAGRFLRINEENVNKPRQYKTRNSALLKSQKFDRNFEKSKKIPETRRISIISTLESNESSASEELNYPQRKLDSSMLSFWKLFQGLKRSNSVSPKIQFGFSQMENFSHIDYRNCTCAAVLNSLCWKFPAQVDLGGNSPFLIRFLMQYGAALIENAEPGYAMKILTMALEKNEVHSVETEKIFGKEEEIDNKGLIFCLMGNACIYLGRYQLAKKNYLEALSVYKYKFLPGKMFSRWNSILETFIRQKFVTRITRSHGETILKNVLKIGQFLHLLSVALMMEGKQMSSLHACHDSLNIGFSGTDSWNFYEKCQLFLSISSNLQQLGKNRLLQILIKNMLQIIRQKEIWRDVEEPIALANVFLSIIKIRSSQGNFAQAVAVGSKLLQLAHILHLNKIKLIALPLLIESMVRLKRINETVDLMHELFYLSPTDSDKSALTWYYAFSMDLILDAGITLESYETCLSFAEQIIADKTLLCVTRDPESKKRLIVSIRTWQLRNGIIGNAFFKSYVNSIEIDGFLQIITTCKILECHLLTLTRSINLRKWQETDNLLKQILKIVYILENNSEMNTFVKPRLYLFKAYLSLIKNHKLIAALNLYKAKKMSKTHGNKMDLAWIIQNDRTWKRIDYNNVTPYWIEYIANVDGIDWKDVHGLSIQEWSSILYPLPVPDPIF